MVVDQTKPAPPKRTRRSLGYFLPYVLAIIVTMVIIGQLGALARTPRTPDAAMLAATGTVVHPTRTSSPTNTALPTPTATHTPTYTPTPSPTSPPPPTNTPTPAPIVTNTALPLPTDAIPTNTMAPTLKPLPPTATPVPVTVLEQIAVDNGSLGRQQIFVRYESDTSAGDQFYVTGTDGYRYRVTMGFLSSPEALAKTQEFWTLGGRGSANWGMLILVRKQIADWYNCPTTTNVCYNTRTDSGQSVLYTDVFLRDAVWKSLLNDYLAGGIMKTTTNTYYYEIQKTIFDPICRQTPTIPCIGFIFTRVS
ncbi:MAG: hypothetical protein ACYCZF_12235 [Anaerolineae bacterium]